MTIWDLLLQFVLSGVMVGSIYALIALGFNIVFNALGRSTGRVCDARRHDRGRVHEGGAAAGPRLRRRRRQ
jgi:hypothetical protein